jgi:hypothetical protein
MLVTAAAASACSPPPYSLCVLHREKLDKERLKALGMGAFASYGVISNVNYGTALT